MSLNPVNSIPDKIVTRVLMNERYCMANFATMMLLANKGSADNLTDLFKEFYYRTLCRDFEYQYEKAQEVLKLNSTMDEVKKLI